MNTISPHELSRSLGEKRLKDAVSCNLVLDVSRRLKQKKHDRRHYEENFPPPKINLQGDKVVKILFFSM